MPRSIMTRLRSEFLVSARDCCRSCCATAVLGFDSPSMMQVDKNGGNVLGEEVRDKVLIDGPEQLMKVFALYRSDEI